MTDECSTRPRSSKKTMWTALSTTAPGWGLHHVWCTFRRVEEPKHVKAVDVFKLDHVSFLVDSEQANV